MNTNQKHPTSFLAYAQTTEIKRLIHQVSNELARREGKALSVISDLPGEGKTFLTAAIATGYSALLRKRVLVVDASGALETGSPSIEQILEPVHNDEAGKIDVVSVNSGTDQGLPGNTEFQLAAWLADQQNKYDLILFDTCALSASGKNQNDPVIISKQVGGAILVLTKRGMATDNVHRLNADFKAWEVNLVGTVFNSGLGK